MLNAFEKVNQVSVLANRIRFKVLLALFSSNVKINNTKVGTSSYSFDELQKIVEVPKNDLGYHLDVMVTTRLVEKDKKLRGVYHITSEGKDILKMFGLSEKEVKKVGKEVIA
jgi:RIO-like serine/threonine protein kinase